jgi:hypothetical protein
MLENNSSTLVKDASYSQTFVPIYQIKHYYYFLKTEAASLSETLVSIYETTEQPSALKVEAELFYPEARDSRFLRNIDIHLSNHRI